MHVANLYPDPQQPDLFLGCCLKIVKLTLLSVPDLNSSTPGQESVCSSFQYMVCRFRLLVQAALSCRYSTCASTPRFNCNFTLGGTFFRGIFPHGRTSLAHLHTPITQTGGQKNRNIQMNPPQFRQDLINVNNAYLRLFFFSLVYWS